jgi:hypothetical protein
MALPATINAVFVELSDSDLIRIFQLACIAAAKRISKTIPHRKFFSPVRLDEMTIAYYNHWKAKDVNALLKRNN